MYTTLGDSVDNKIAVHGVFEPGTSTLVQCLAPLCADFLDVGCNIGYFSCLFASTDPEKRVIGIDPNPEMLVRTRENLSLNLVQNYVLINCGVGRMRSTKLLNVPRNRHSLSSFAYAPTQGGEVDTIASEIIPLSEIIASHGVDQCFLKIDTEGYEKAVLDGIGRDQYKSIHFLLFEISYANLKLAKISPDEIFSLPVFESFDLYVIKERVKSPLVPTTAQRLASSAELNGNVLMVNKSLHAKFLEVAEPLLAETRSNYSRWGQ